MTRTRRLLVLVAATAVTFSATACDASPYAATVNGSKISQIAFQAELRARFADTAYVQTLDQQGSQIGLTVEGTAPGAYGATFSAYVLNQLVQGLAIHQYLLARQSLPSPAALAAARAIQELQFAAAWQAFPAPVRNRFVQQLAERAYLEPPSAATANAHLAFQANPGYFFSSVCTHQTVVSVPTPGGGVDFAASMAKAATIASGYASTPSGTARCYTPSELEATGPGVFAEVVGLAVGTAGAPIRTRNGYLVVGVDSRVLQEFGPDAAAVVSYVIELNNSSTDYTPSLVKVMSSAHIQVNPAFGSWDRSQLAIEMSGVPALIEHQLKGNSAQLGTPS